MTTTAYVSALQLRWFRSYERLDLDLQPGVVVLTGPNGVGKTNALEGLAVGLSGRSPRTSAEGNCIAQGHGAYRVAVEVVQGGAEHTASVVYDGRRALIADDDGVPTLGVYAERTPVVVFLPERLLVVRGAPSRRRGMLDKLATRTFPNAAPSFDGLAKAIVQRNALLRQLRAGRADHAALTPWTDRVIEHGRAVRETRARTIDLLKPAFEARFEQLTALSGGSIEVAFRGGEDLEAAFAGAIEDDVRRGASTVGAHLDDISLVGDDRDLRTFGSTGEQRSSLLAWTLAEHDILGERFGVEPVVLLDEPFAELDIERRERLSTVLQELGQVVVTATERPPEADQHSALVLRVRQGTIEADSGTILR
jgi:DNA replication and repair protein RecF